MFARNILGPADVYPTYFSQSRAWSPFSAGGTGHFIEVYKSKSNNIQQT